LERLAEFHFGRGEAYRLLGEGKRAAAEYEAALTFNNNLSEARIGLCLQRMPGQDFRAWLDWFHRTLRPTTYLEIGIAAGRSLALARPPTRAIGVDPVHRITEEFKAETHVVTATSDDFFARDALRPFLGGEPLALAFIDGDHVFEQALKDFINIERYCGPRSVVLLHDTMPLDEPMQERVKRIDFYAGDIWKTVLCLKHYRPDIDVFTIATPWTGLTVVTGLNPASDILPKVFQEAAVRFAAARYLEYKDKWPEALNVVANDIDVVAERLKLHNAL
jgi:hypothetical protein